MSLPHAVAASAFSSMPRTALPIAFLLLAANVSATRAAAAIPSDGIYEVQTPAVHSAPRFIVEQGQLRHASGGLHTPLCQHVGATTTQFPVTELKTFFDGYPGTQVLDRGNGHYLLTTGLVLDEYLRFPRIESGSMTAIHAELIFATGDEGTLTLQVATPYFLGQGLDTTHCLARSQFRVKKLGS